MNATFPKSSFSPAVRLDDGLASPMPRLWLNAGVGIPHRHLKAALHAAALAAEIETEPAERWVIGVEVSSDSRGYVYIETLTGTDSEARRGVLLLRKAMERVFTTGA